MAALHHALAVFFALADAVGVTRPRPEANAPIVPRVLLDERGTTAIEYSLIACLVGVALIVAMTAVRGSLDQLFLDVSGAVDSAISG